MTTASWTRSLRQFCTPTRICVYLFALVMLAPLCVGLLAPDSAYGRWQTHLVEDMPRVCLCALQGEYGDKVEE